MTFLGIDKNGKEWIYEFDKDRTSCPGNCPVKYNFIELPSGTIEKILGRKLKPNGEPVKLSHLNQ